MGSPERPVPFGGRQDEIDALNWWLNTDSNARKKTEEKHRNAVLGPNLNSNNLLITAPAGRGKTALLVRWIDQLETNHHLVFVPISIRYQTNQASTFYNALATRLAEIVDEELPQPRSDPATYYREKTIEYIDCIERKGIPCLIVLDGLDEARGWRVDTTVLPSNPTENLRIVISARELAGHSGSKQWLDTLGWSSPQSGGISFRVGPLSLEGIADVLRQMGFPLEHFSRDIDVINELYRLTDKGDPLLLTLYVNDLISDREEVKRLKAEDLQYRKPGFAAYFQNWIEQQRKEWHAAGKKVDEELIDALFAVFASAHGPLRLADIESLVSVLLPEERLFSTRTLEPISRFIIGDGRAVGYALAHPKLADYLREEYFEGTNILVKTRDVFVDWMSSIVTGLNSGKKEPEATPPYALLYFTQHLNELPLSKALPLFRSVVENGWRRAWIAQEGGTLGFTRDIELAAEAFRVAVKKNPEAWQAPRTGLGAQIRCTLCLSSLRSIGKGMPFELLRELLRSKNLTPTQALHLAQLKTDRDRGNAIAAIIKYLPTDLIREAYAAIREIANPLWKGEALVSIAKYISAQERTAALRETLSLIPRIEMKYDRDAILEKLKDWTQTEHWLERELQQVIMQSAQATDSNGSERGIRDFLDSDKGGNADTEDVDVKLGYNESSPILEELNGKWLSQKRLREIIELLPCFKGYYVEKIIEAMGKHLDEDLRSELLNWLEHAPMEPYNIIDSIEALVKFMSNEELLRSLNISLQLEPYNLPDIALSIIQNLPEKIVSEAIALIDQVPSEFHRQRVLLKISWHLPNQKYFQECIKKLAQFDYFSDEEVGTIQKSTDNFSPDVILEIIQSLYDSSDIYPNADILRGLIRNLPESYLKKVVPYLSSSRSASALAKTIVELTPRLPVDLLQDCFDVVTRIDSLSERGKALAAMLPRLHEVGESVSIKDAYQTSFLIGDGRERRLAELSVAFQGMALSADQVKEAALGALESDHSFIEEGGIALHVCSVVLVAEKLEESRRKALLSEAKAIALTVQPPGRELLLGILSIAYEGQTKSDLLREATAFATRLKGEEGVMTLAVLAFVHPENEFRKLLATAERATERVGDISERKRLAGIVAVVISLLSGETGSTLSAGIAKLIEENTQASKQEIIDAWSHALPLAIAPKLPSEDARKLRQVVLRAIENLVPQEDYESRLLASGAIAPYLEGDELVRGMAIWMDAAQQSSRDMVLISIAIMQGVFAKVVQHRPELAGNLIKGSPLKRLGSATAVEETLEAIADVCSWWP